MEAAVAVNDPPTLFGGSALRLLRWPCVATTATPVPPATITAAADAIKSRRCVG